LTSDTDRYTFSKSTEKKMELMTHQVEDAAFLANKKFAGNFSGMGSGKTLTALEAINLLKPFKTDDKILIVCPPIAMHMWKQEFERHCRMPAVIVTKRTSPTSGIGGGFDFSCNAFIMSYDIAVHRKELFTKLIAAHPTQKLRVLICDESHALKSHKAKRTSAILGKGGICEVAEHSWMLTGTPQTRWNDDMFPFLCRANNKGLRQAIGSVTMNKFLLRYCATQERRFGNSQYATRITVGNRNTDELNELIFNEENPLAVRRSLQEVWDQMPPLTHTELVVDVPISPTLKKAMEKEDAYLLTGLSAHSRSDESYAEGFRKSPELATIRRELGLAKVPVVVNEIYQRVEDGHSPLLVGAWHHEVIDSLAMSCNDKNIKVAVLDGRTSAKKKQELQDAFNNKELDVLIGQISAMGVAINLQAGGSRILVAEQDWSPSIMDQFYARLHRMGQKSPVHIDTIISNTKIDKAITRISKTKMREHARIMRQGVA
jgi:SNF2 family DNA or RNA helicase